MRRSTRRRSFWRRLGRGLLWCLAVLVVLDVAATIVTGHRLKAALARVKAEGAPVTFAEAAPPPIPAEQNAAPLYLQVADIIKPHTFSGEGETSSTGTGYVRAAGQPLGYSGADWANPEDIKGLAELLRQDARALELLDRAAAMPGCRFDADWSETIPTSMLHFSKLRDVARLCADAIAAAAAQGDAALTARRLRAGLAVAIHTAHEPTFISQSTAYACLSLSHKAAEFALSRCPLSEVDSRAILALLTGTDLRANLEKALQAERGRSLEFYNMLRKKPSDPASRIGGSDAQGDLTAWVVWLCVHAAPPLVNHDETAYLECMERSIEVATAPGPDYPRLSRELQNWSEKRLKWTILARMSGTALSRAAVPRLNCQAHLNLLCGALGLAVYKQRFGQYPEALTDLARINWPVPQDPFSTGLLRYQRTGDRYLLYSIGPDGVDDGGKPTWKWRIDRTGPEPSEDDRDKGDLPWQWR